MEKKIAWCIDQHSKTNHLYGDYLPYRYHLESVVRYVKKFAHCESQVHLIDLILAAYGHDLIEDTRVTYNDVRRELGVSVANIIYALTNEKGKNRKERANEKYYKEIMNTPGARFIKLCDRLANAQFSTIIESNMRDVYRKENEFFLKKLEYKGSSDNLYPMFHELEFILNHEA